MEVIIRNRTIRPSTRDSKSAYRVKVIKADSTDKVIIFIDHESIDFRAIYECTGALFQDSDSIYFRVVENEGLIKIIWRSGQEPNQLRLKGNKLKG